MPRSRRLQLADLVAIGAGEAALHVAEQLRFEQRLGQAGAVDRDERPAARGDSAWSVAGDEILADAALAGDEDLGVADGGAPRQAQHFRHRGTRADLETATVGSYA